MVALAKVREKTSGACFGTSVLLFECAFSKQALCDHRRFSKLLGLLGWLFFCASEFSIGVLIYNLRII